MGAEGAKALLSVLGHLTQLRELYLRGEYANVCVKASFGSACVCDVCLYICLLVGLLVGALLVD